MEYGLTKVLKMTFLRLGLSFLSSALLTSSAQFLWTKEIFLKQQSCFRSYLSSFSARGPHMSSFVVL